MVATIFPALINASFQPFSLSIRDTLSPQHLVEEMRRPFLFFSEQDPFLFSALDSRSILAEPLLSPLRSASDFSGLPYDKEVRTTPL